MIVVLPFYCSQNWKQGWALFSRREPHSQLPLQIKPFKKTWITEWLTKHFWIYFSTCILWDLIVSWVYTCCVLPRVSTRHRSLKTLASQGLPACATHVPHWASLCASQCSTFAATWTNFPRNFLKQGLGKLSTGRKCTWGQCRSLVQEQKRQGSSMAQPFSVHSYSRFNLGNYL